MRSTSHQADYGIYTASDENFFAGTVASLNALRYYGYHGPVAIFDLGFVPWMREYLSAFPEVQVLDMAPLVRSLRFTDERSMESPVLKDCAFKAFGIVQYDLFRTFTFLDADYLPLSNVAEVLRPLIDQGHFVSTEDGINEWDARHQDAMGVEPGRYLNINAGFISLDLDRHGPVIHEWRNLMTRRKPFELWHGDQGALNAILDKWGVPKHTLDRVLWNQTWLNEDMARENRCHWVEEAPPGQSHVWYEPRSARIMGWHGTGWHKLWHQIGIDHFRKGNWAERIRFAAECRGKSPGAVVRAFEHFLFLDQFHPPLTRAGHLLEVRDG